MLDNYRTTITQLLHAETWLVSKPSTQKHVLNVLVRPIFLLRMIVIIKYDKVNREQNWGFFRFRLILEASWPTEPVEGIFAIYKLSGPGNSL